ncbi:MAG: thioredoxin domain-containing protein [Arenimonas sp.]
MPNRLADEPSLYLRQHAANPVDWHAWGAEALALARAGDRPILVSIGYSACHWCHVMAHESFEDAETGALMNALFVNIKVDREERPDLDRIYQLAHQALSRRGGGWPLTVFLDPHDLVPFFAGTYYPPQPRHGLPAFSEVLQGVRNWWDTRRDDVRAQNVALGDFLADHGREAPQLGALDAAPLQAARAAWLAAHDPVHGGHRGGPKFPHAGEAALMLDAAVRGDVDCTVALERTLAGMARGGLYDHLAGGFFRYCVDERWDIPHFEKMLYDNALLLPLYARAAARLDVPEWERTAEGVVAWLRAEMRAGDGGYASALDADSEGEEGRFYVWSTDELHAVLPDDGRIAAAAFGFDRPPNFEGSHWHVHALRTPEQVVAAGLADGRDATAVADAIERARCALRDARAHRVRPARDDKRLVSWNALLATGLAQAGDALRRDDWVDEGATLCHRLLDERDVRGRLPAVVGSNGPGFLDDHAFALQACLAQLEARWDGALLRAAIGLADTLLADFAEGGATGAAGFCFTAHDHEPLPQRPRPWLDESTPSGNGIAARSLLVLGHLLAEPRYLKAAEGTLRAGWTTLAQLPQAAASMLGALEEFLAPKPQVVLRGDEAALARWRAALRSESSVRMFAIPESAGDLPEALASKPTAAEGRATVCQGMRCLAMVDSVETLRDQLASIAAA